MESKPVFELRKTSEGFIITSDEEIKDRDFTLSPTDNTVFQMHKVFVSVDIGNYKKVIAQQDQIDFSALSEEEQKEIGWFDVEKLASKEYSPNIYNSYAIDGYKKGFQKSQELLSDRRFSLDEVRQSFWKCFENRGLGYSVTMGDLEVELSKSLSQKSWKVEVEVEKETLYTDDGLDYKGNLIPKLTNDKIKILKLC
jgi:hypothetical protein